MELTGWIDVLRHDLRDFAPSRAVRFRRGVSDHPQAFANYQARGMLVYKIEQEP